MAATLRTGLFPLLAGLCLLASPALPSRAMAAPDDFSSPGNRLPPQNQDGVEAQHGEDKTVVGRRSLPPGYQDAPSMDMNHGPDPDHEANVHRDAVTGSDLSRFGNAYQSSGPYGQGQMGDATGNGWVTPR
ncbi:conserved hypothetical protein [Gluconacetobacter diazotrophicus PA1 5]|uniref:Uncharacterized protein n=2 Tax=Gluconacetobacter diazotrophicus TaxID=33996 RepID=A0A7W4FBW6_GLUDI|nr:conserved hypothetical protein [Gluconacetobacter diazotrophicus PA1 5]MBB2154858.1 hypothetical protein [Gluconacetobacter diazotrophicus]TWB08015.1 hypothetical protein FBZ86_10833 [Gluconacetobacter diazotrophicus]